MSAASLPNFTGCIIDDRYELLQMLGSGTFGVVYKAIDLEVADNFDNIVAVKIVRKAGRGDAELAIIKREVAMHSVVADIEGVVTLIDAFDDAKWCYIVLEFCQGGDLFEQIITKQSYLGNDELLRRAFLSLVDAVQACHDAGIAHRDLKPENVLISQDGSRCYLADFGLATNQPVVRDFGIGTGLYMSPECVGELTARQAYDPYLSDIWALGVILVNMITAQNPWARATPKDANFCQFVMDPDFLFNASPMSEGAHAIIQSLLDLHPAGRMCLRSLRQAILSLDTFFR
ncbi:kinase-like domain-containing protein, partial [Ganoderma leucocontextum]